MGLQLLVTGKAYTKWPLNSTPSTSPQFFPVNRRTIGLYLVPRVSSYLYSKLAHLVDVSACTQQLVALLPTIGHKFIGDKISIVFKATKGGPPVGSSCSLPASIVDLSRATETIWFIICLQQPQSVKLGNFVCKACFVTPVLSLLEVSFDVTNIEKKKHYRSTKF
jgi:hypothetical protein